MGKCDNNSSMSEPLSHPRGEMPLKRGEEVLEERERGEKRFHSGLLKVVKKFHSLKP